MYTVHNAGKETRFNYDRRKVRVAASFLTYVLFDPTAAKWVQRVQQVNAAVVLDSEIGFRHQCAAFEQNDLKVQFRVGFAGVV
jgi:hypothetical protein